MNHVKGEWRRIKMIIKKKVEVERIVCDYCKKELDNYYNKCAVCGKDVCNEHAAQQEEDGNICKMCNKEGYKIKYHGDGSVGVQKRGKGVKAPYL